MNLIVYLKTGKKTEIIACLKKVSPNTAIQFSDNFSIELKKKKKTNFTFGPDGQAPEGGILKGKSIKVPPGIGKDAYPDIKEPVRVEHTRTTGGYGGGGEKKKMDIPPQNNRPNPQPRRGIPPPRQQNDEDDGQDAPPPRRTGPPPRGRIPPRSQDNDDDGQDAPPPRRTGRLPMTGIPRMPLPPM